MRSPRAGFTLIELLIVVVIIGLIAAIALPKLVVMKDRAAVASMKSDLRNLASAQESYWNDYQTYYGGAVPSASLVYNPTQSVTITITDASNAGWAAQATRIASSVTCALYIGPVSPPSPAKAEGAIACQ